MSVADGPRRDWNSLSETIPAKQSSRPQFF